MVHSDYAVEGVSRQYLCVNTLDHAKQRSTTGPLEQMCRAGHAGAKTWHLAV